ncbi:MAG: cupin domain-containing protein [Ilumatobacteraceae bacterium]
MPTAIDLDEKLGQFDATWSPHTVATFNGHDIAVVKADGDFVWHQHDDTDDFFLVLRGELVIDLPDGSVTLGPGQLYVVPAGVQHRPRATGETHVLLIEPTGTPNTGDVTTAATRRVI